MYFNVFVCIVQCVFCFYQRLLPFIKGNYRGAAALYEQIIQEDPDGFSHHEVLSSNTC